MTRQYEHSDDSVVVVIGSGAGGGTIANELAQKGIDVVCLEAGSRLTLADIVNDPPAMEAKMARFVINPPERRTPFCCAAARGGGTRRRPCSARPRSAFAKKRRSSISA